MVAWMSASSLVRGGGRLVGSSRIKVGVVGLALSVSAGASVCLAVLTGFVQVEPVGVRDPQAVVAVFASVGTRGTSEKRALGVAGVRRLERLPVFEAAAGQVLTSGRNALFLPVLGLEAMSQPLEVAAVTWSYFRVLGVTVSGRDFRPEDDRPDAELVAIASDRFWRYALAKEPESIGSVLRTTRVPVRLVGIAQAGFVGARVGEQYDLWVPAGAIAPNYQVRPPWTRCSDVGLGPPALGRQAG